MTLPPDDDLYSERELAEIDELNRMTDDRASFFQSKWWKRGAIVFALIIVLSLLLPILVLVRGGSSRAPVETPTAALQVPDFELEAAQGGTVRLSDEVAANSAVVLVFYRGYF